MKDNKDDVTVKEFEYTVAYFKLKQLLKEKGISQRLFMAETETSYDTVRNYKKGLVTKPDMMVIDRWCKYLKCAPEDIIKFEKK